ncbi:MAG TPA: MFS transporter, partial [Clostridia bacterium]|nr:MFS transporter [Clostridia bacterium]
IGLCLCGFLYSFAPTVTATFTLAFFGRKHFPLNFPVLTLTLIPASFAPTIAGSLSYESTYLLLLGIAVIGAALNLSIKKA